MRWAEQGLAVALLLAGIAHADAPTYGKVETFQPGKKYNCVPTPDHKAWDCSESGRAAQQPPSDAAAAPPSPASTPPAEPAPKASALPSYLTNTAASSRTRTAPAPATSPPPAAASRPVAESPVEPKTAPPPTAQGSAAVAERSPAPPPSAEPPPAAAPVEKSASAPRNMRSSAESSDHEFANLPGTEYVIELAHADSSAINSPAVPQGKVYKLHLRQNGAERWLLLWGPFDSVESARAARDEIAAQGATPGWPRRIAPLQAEARDIGD